MFGSQFFIGQDAGVDGNREQSGSLGCPYTQGCVLYYVALLFVPSGALPCFEIGLGIRFAVLHVKRRDDALEHIVKSLVEGVDQVALTGAGDDPALDAAVMQVLQHFPYARNSARETACFLVEIGGLILIDGLDQFLCGRCAVHTLMQLPDHARTGASFVAVGLKGGVGQTVLGHGPCPCLRMVWHRVIEHTVLVKKYGF